MRLEQGVKRQAERIVQQLWDDACQQRRAYLQVRVCVALNQVDLELLVQHKVIAKYFKAVVVAVRIDGFVDGSETICDEPLHAGKQISHELHVLAVVIRVEEALEIIDRKFIRSFELPIVICMHLNSVVCEVDLSIRQVAQVKGLRTRPKVNITIHVAFENAVMGSEHCIRTHVKFPALYQQWLLDI